MKTKRKVRKPEVKDCDNCGNNKCDKCVSLGKPKYKLWEPKQEVKEITLEDKWYKDWLDCINSGIMVYYCPLDGKYLKHRCDLTFEDECIKVNIRKTDCNKKFKLTEVK